MNNSTAGWTLGLAALAMMLGLMSGDIAKVKTWTDVTQPVFVADMCAHLSAVIMAFVGGKLIPTSPQDQRKDDPKP